MSVLSAGSIFIKDLGRCTANDPSFTCLDWSDVRLDAADVKLLATALLDNTHLLTLTVRYGIYMTNRAAEQLESALMRTRIVRAIVLGRSYAHNGRRVVRDFNANTNTRLRSHCVANAARRAIENDHALTEIDWSNMSLEDEDICTLAASLMSNTELQRICLSNNRGISDRAVANLASAIATCACLRVEIDGCHRVSRAAATALRRVCVSNACSRVKAGDIRLAEVNWSNTDADDDDVAMLAAALEGSSKVNSISLAHNRSISDAGANALQSMLQHCNVVAIALDVTSVGEQLKTEIRRLCVNNAARRIAANDRDLVELDWRVMRRESPRSVQAHTVSNDVKSISQLRTVYAPDAVHNDDILDVFAALRRNSSLRVIRLAGNRSLTLKPHPGDILGAVAALDESRVCRLELDGTGICFSVQARLRHCCLRNANLVRHRPYQRLLLAALHQRPDMIRLPFQDTTRGHAPQLLYDIMEMVAEKLEACPLSPLLPPMISAKGIDAFHDDAFSAKQLSEMMPTFQWHEQQAGTSS